MQYATTAWERERSGWRAVVQLNIVRSIITILSVVEAEMNGMPQEENVDVEAEDTPITEVTEDTDPVKFSDAHQLMMIRLAPLRNVEVELKRRLGAATEAPHPHLPMSATPFEVPKSEPSVKRRLNEFSVRCWNDAVDPDARKTQTSDTADDLDSCTNEIAACKNDMKALWTDQSVQLALTRRKIRLPDSAGLYVLPLLVTMPDMSH
jgi:guanine nucleotide-binding protein alpha-1 subunit